MTNHASHCEAKLHGFRRTADGVVVSFVLHPAEVPQALALDPLGTRYMLAVAQIGDDEHPVSPAGTHQSTMKGVISADGYTVPNQKPSMPPAGERHKTPEERAVIRAAILCSEPQFRIWLAGEDISAAQAAAMLREACGVESRRDISTDPEALRKFLAIETDYKISFGELAEPR